MENVIESMPNSLQGELSKSLISIVIGSEDKNAISTELAKKIIYLWRRDQLATTTGILTLLEASVMVDVNLTREALDTLGLNQVAAELWNS